MTELWELAFLALFVFVVAEAFAVLALGRAIGLIQLRIGPDTPALETSDGLAVEANAPAVSGVDLKLGEFATVPVSTGRWLLLFVTATCHTCRSVVRDAGRVSGDRTWGANVVLIARSSHEENEAFRDSAQSARLISDPLGAVHEAFSISRTPVAMLVESGHIVAKGIVNNRDQLELLLEHRRTVRRSHLEDAWTVDARNPAPARIDVKET